MPHCSHITNPFASEEVRTYPADFRVRRAHNANMARRGVPKGRINWYFPEWMRYFGIKKQTDIMEKTGWSKATVSQIMTGKQDYSPKIVNEAAAAFHLAPFELLMTPDDAMAYRRLRRAAEEMVQIPFMGTAGEGDPDESRTGTDG